ncbi:peptidoglycan-recognition protein LC isoform X2 [Drosophila eugracilis]|uniref:peptidoglycan-recognition protein LC isoform X2 n=1 Tax=Drosophila eugracilis TaxID=29029 RepID=UPI0007E6C29F|nr:peptidoglycan-recognition protein LC isoform X2 [Drosophila eugracilis]XP_041673600.1 peptidoglycan-recognition protein LC isoform X2 [Drosophila eugracilis]
MHFSNETEMIQCPNTKRRLIDPTSAPKNCSTSSTDSGVILNDNAASFRPDKETKDRGTDDGESKSKSETKTEPKRISIEHTVNITNEIAGKTSSSPAVSIRSTTISIVSIDENAIDSSCIDSDSEAEAEDYTVQKLGQQVTYPPNSTNLRDLNQGLTVISRQVAPGQSEQPPPNPLEAGVVAKQILNGSLELATPTSPAGGATQGIGSIALTNSTDVTFGDKHFYEGPVTIQQFLIDNRDKWKAGEGPGGGQDNPAFNGGATTNGNAPGSKLDDPAQTPPLCPFLPNTIGRKAVTITVVFVLFTFLLGIILATTTNIFGKTLNQTSDDSEVYVDGKLVLIGIKSWGGLPTRGKIEPLNLPVSRVIISDSGPENCETRESCSYWTRVVQSRHIDTYNWGQIGYNFLVGGDGRIYVGRGWDYEGAHTRDNNKSSIGISFLGNFRRSEPTQKSLEACQLLIDQGVRLKKLKPDYQILGHRQITGSLMPAEELYRVIQTWPHWYNLTKTWPDLHMTH